METLLTLPLTNMGFLLRGVIEKITVYFSTEISLLKTKFSFDFKINCNY